MKKEHYITLIDAFGAVVPEWGTKVEIEGLMPIAVQRGYVFEADASNTVLNDYLISKGINPNSTFYKSFQDVVSKNRFELFIDQVLHYASTYGTDYEGEVYCPNGDPIEIPYSTYKVIKAISAREMYDRVIKMLNSGVALATETVEAFSRFVIESVSINHFELNVDAIANRDAMAGICDGLGIVPTESDNILRIMKMKITGNPMIVQSKRELAYVSSSAQLAEGMINSFDEDRMIELSKSFLRYRMFWLAIKRGTHNKRTRAVINKIRQLAKANHKPMKVGFWEGLTRLDAKEVMRRLPAEIEKLDNAFKIVRLLEMVKLRKIQNQSRSARIFRIRNGRTFVDANKFANYPLYLDDVAKALITKLVYIMSDVRTASKKQTIKFPENLDIVLPSSEKTFVGNVPCGSTYNLKDKDNYFGIYWRNEWGTHDFDLSFIADNGSRIGWDVSYYDHKQNIIFSGDMTNANPEATEMFYVHKDCPDGILYVNRYNGEPGSKFRLFFGQDECVGFQRNYMVDPDTILVNEMVESPMTSAQQVVGRISNGVVYILNTVHGSGAVARFDREFNKSMKDSLAAHVSLKDLVIAAGYTEWDPESKTEPDINLANLNKDTILSLMS